MHACQSRRLRAHFPSIIVLKSRPVLRRSRWNSTTDGLNAGACLNKLTGQCTLREAIQEANSQAGAMIDIPAGTYTLTIPPAGGDDNTTGDLNVTAAMTLVGTGTTIIKAGASQTAGIDRVFHITGNGTVSVSNVVIEFGQTNNSSDLAN